jgi:HEAT repeat protein
MTLAPDSVTTLINNLQGDDDVVRSEAALALVLMGAAAVQPLVELLSSPNADTRMRSAWVLGAIGGPALPAMIDLVQSEDQRLRTEAIRIMGVIGQTEALDHLMHALADPNAEIAARSARAIGRLGDPRAFHALTTALHHPEPDVRYEVCRALANLRMPEALPILGRIAATDESHTRWGASVASVADYAIQELQAVNRSRTDQELERLSRLINQQLDENQSSDQNENESTS